MKKVFLAGTCNGSKWKEELIKLLKIDYYNPTTEDWTEECIKEEIKQREICDCCLYVITPRMAGTYSIAEVIDDSNKRPNKTIFCWLEEDIMDSNLDLIVFNKIQQRSLDRVGKMVEINGGKYFTSLEEVAEYLNSNNKCKNRNINTWIGRKIRHFKEKEYLVLDVAWHTEQEEYVVCYKALYGECKTYVRPLEMFMNKVDRIKYPNATQEYRMELIEE